MSLESRLVRCWYGKAGWCGLLFPLAMLYGLISALRRRYYRLRPVSRLPVPVIVIGNLTVGGTGKTPLVLWLVKRLRAAGYHPGIISRGYGATSQGICAVPGSGDAAVFGDEPVLLARRNLCPVWIGHRRSEVGRALLAAHPDIDVIVADDGLQHYALARDMEIVVVDGRRGFGNGLLMPAGPLRESRQRLMAVDAVVIHGGDSLPDLTKPTWRMDLRGGMLHNLAEPSRQLGPEHFFGRTVHALAGIGHPERFFDTLKGLGITIMPHAFPDHHAYTRDELPVGEVIMTEKDAVKCLAFGRDDIWVYVVDAEVSEGLEKQVLIKLGLKNG